MSHHSLPPPRRTSKPPGPWPHARPDSASWTAAKEAGDEAELAVADSFRADDFEVLRSIGSASWDLELRQRVEVKRDIAAERTGRLAIETQYNGRPSGIRTTTARTWVLIVGRRGFIVRVSALRRLLQDHPDYPVRPAVDGNRAQVRLVPVGDLEQVAAVFDV